MKTVAIATRLVEGMVTNGELDPNDHVALKKATAQCCRDAFAAYRAAEAFLSG